MRLIGTMPMIFLLMMGTVTQGDEAESEADFDIEAEAEKIVNELLGEPQALPDLPSKPQIRWDLDLSLKAGGGYRENVLYSAYQEVNSPYSTAEIDAFLFREGDLDNQLYLYLFGDQQHYFDLDRADNEQSVLAEATWLHYFTPLTATELSGNYFFIDQFFDASISEVETDEFRLVQHDLMANGELQQRLNNRLKLSIGGGGGEVFVEDSNDDYSQWELLGRLEYRPYRRGRCGLLYRREIDLYHHRIQRTAIGNVIPDEKVDLSTDSVRLYCSHDLDRRGIFRIYANLTGYDRADNGGGYYDYDRIRAGTGLRYDHNRWEASLNLSYNDTDYPYRPSEFLEPESALLYRERVSVWAHAQYHLHDHWFLFSEINWEDNQSNDELDDYAVISGAIGIGFRR